LYAGAFVSDFYAKLFDLYNNKPLETSASNFLEASYRGEPEETFIAEILMDQVTSQSDEKLGEHIEALASNILFADTERKISEKRNELKILKDETRTLETVNQIVALENFKRSLRK
jgi:hypothetical protein